MIKINIVSTNFTNSRIFYLKQASRWVLLLILQEFLHRISIINIFVKLQYIYIYMNNICNFNFFFLTLSERGKERNIFLWKEKKNDVFYESIPGSTMEFFEMVKQRPWLAETVGRQMFGRSMSQLLLVIAVCAISRDTEKSSKFVPGPRKSWIFRPKSLRSSWVAPLLPWFPNYKLREIWMPHYRETACNNPRWVRSLILEDVCETSLLLFKLQFWIEDYVKISTKFKSHWYTIFPIKSFQSFKNSVQKQNSQNSNNTNYDISLYTNVISPLCNDQFSIKTSYISRYSTFFLKKKKKK